MNILSLGAGVQSSTMALMAAHGFITPMPDAAIFADTGWEHEAMEEHLSDLERAIGIRIDRVGYPGGMSDLCRKKAAFQIGRAHV